MYSRQHIPARRSFCSAHATPLARWVLVALGVLFSGALVSACDRGAETGAEAEHGSRTAAEPGSGTEREEAAPNQQEGAPEEQALVEKADESANGEPAGKGESGVSGEKALGSKKGGDPAEAAQRQALFGDLHVHTSWSLDAWAAMTRKGPDEAYRFAKGEALEHTDGETIQLARPLDFAAVTDHAEFLGEMAIARSLGEEGEDSPWAEDEEVRTLWNAEETVQNGRWSIQRFNLRELSEVPPERDGLENVPAEDVLKAARKPWSEIVASANRHNEPGEFTAFIGFEWTHMPNSAMLHRNIIYRGSEAPVLPVSRYEKSSPEELWDWLDSERAAGRTAIAIPHNTNWSNGLAFAPKTYSASGDGEPLTGEAGRKWAEQRARLEPQVEIFQNKGASETAPRWATEDEWADFEILFPDAPRTSYVREGLKEGLRLAATLGVNPFAVGIIASTDTHSATPGAVSEEDFRGHNGISDDEPGERLGLKRGMYGNSLSYNPGGLAGVWAEENSRAAIFDALVRKETFGTSGPRIRVRSFVLPAASDDFLERDNAVERAYATGWPMGATVSAAELGDTPVFVLWATQDPDGAKLERLQVVKGWYEFSVEDSGNSGSSDRGSGDGGGEGELQEQVIDVKVAEDGAAELKALWQDPDYDPGQHAFYYVRVLEVPTARWPMHDAAKLGMLDVNLEEGRIQERAWGSPIWVVP